MSRHQVSSSLAVILLDQISNYANLCQNIGLEFEFELDLELDFELKIALNAKKIYI